MTQETSCCLRGKEEVGRDSVLDFKKQVRERLGTSRLMLSARKESIKSFCAKRREGEEGAGDAGRVRVDKQRLQIDGAEVEKGGGWRGLRLALREKSLPE